MSTTGKATLTPQKNHFLKEWFGNFSDTVFAPWISKSKCMKPLAGSTCIPDQRAESYQSCLRWGDGRGDLLGCLGELCSHPAPWPGCTAPNRAVPWFCLSKWTPNFEMWEILTCQQTCTTIPDVQAVWCIFETIPAALIANAILELTAGKWQPNASYWN